MYLVYTLYLFSRVKIDDDVDFTTFFVVKRLIDCGYLIPPPSGSLLNIERQNLLITM